MLVTENENTIYFTPSNIHVFYEIGIVSCSIPRNRYHMMAAQQCLLNNDSKQSLNVG